MAIAWRLVEQHEELDYNSRCRWNAYNIGHEECNCCELGYAAVLTVLKFGHEECNCWRATNPDQIELFRPCLLEDHCLLAMRKRWQALRNAEQSFPVLNSLEVPELAMEVPICTTVAPSLRSGT